MKRLALVAALGLGGCAAGLESTLVAAPAASVVGVATPAVALTGVDAELTRLQAELERRVAGRDWGVPLQLSRSPEAHLRVRLGADESFDPGTAQLRITALALYAELAAALRGAPVVTHVLVHGDVAGSEPATDLTARRAASVLNYLATQQLVPTRLRAEGRGASEPATIEANAGAVQRRVELVVKPIIAGHEAEAWLPPLPAGCGTGCPVPHG
jgi:outer membrane protein OmpA-like peptidoglycan-associated protein